MDNMSFIVLKIGKLSRAVYLVTDFMSDREPLKWRLRQLALQILALVEPPEAMIYSEKLARAMREMLNLIDLSLATGTVSQMNFALLQQEYKNLLGLVLKDASKNLTSETKVEALMESNLTSPSASLKTGSKPAVTTGVIRPSETIKDNGDLLDKRQRQDRILSHMRGRGWLSIKDIANAIPTFSSKTVQRELTEMSEKGLVKKRGERRWSRYLAN